MLPDAGCFVQAWTVYAISVRTTQHTQYRPLYPRVSLAPPAAFCDGLGRLRSLPFRRRQRRRRGNANSQVPLIEHFFGVVPHAARRQIVLQPRFPAAWAHAELHELRVGHTTISVEWQSGDATERLRLHCAHRSWVVHVLLDHTCKHVSVDGVSVHAPPVSFSASDVLRAEMSGRLVPVRFSCSGCARVVVCEHEARGHELGPH